MDNGENTFPMDVTDPSSRPWKFRPRGYLVVILASSEEAQRAATALVAEGFATRDIKLYTGKRILDNQKEYINRRGVTSIGRGLFDRRRGGPRALPRLRA